MVPALQELPAETERGVPRASPQRSSAEHSNPTTDTDQCDLGQAPAHARASVSTVCVKEKNDSTRRPRASVRMDGLAPGRSFAWYPALIRCLPSA